MAPQKCAHESCNCTVSEKGEFGKYCSDHCREAAKITELRCGCNHQGCR